MATPRRAFVSSTSIDLKEYRRIALDTCLSLGVFPVAMEYFAATRDGAITGSLKALETADIYIGIYAHRYGYVPQDAKVSVTEAEYDYAKESNLPRLLFVAYPEAIWPAHHVDRGDSAIKLDDFKRKVMTESIVNFFRSPEELQAKLAISLIYLLYGRGDTGAEPITIDGGGTDTEGRLVIKPIFGYPRTTDSYRGDVFLIMPFSNRFDVVRSVIGDTANELYLTTRRADDFFSTGSILSDVWSAIFGSRVIIADLSSSNPNVMYELGIAHTLGKPTLLLTQDMNDVPFDLRSQRVITYNVDNPDLLQLRSDIREALSRLISI